MSLCRPVSDISIPVERRRTNHPTRGWEGQKPECGMRPVVFLTAGFCKYYNWLIGVMVDQAVITLIELQTLYGQKASY
jgi:hypothetical protein